MTLEMNRANRDDFKKSKISEKAFLEFFLELPKVGEVLQNQQFFRIFVQFSVGFGSKTVPK